MSEPTIATTTAPVLDDTWRAHDLPARWAGRSHFVALLTNFGTGEAFLSLRRAWLNDPGRSRRLTVVAVAAQPPDAHVLLAEDTALAPHWLAVQPGITPGLNTIEWPDQPIRLLLAVGPLAGWLSELTLQANAVLISDGPEEARSANQPVDDDRLGKALARLCAPDATLTAMAASEPLRRGLRQAGFVATNPETKHTPLANIWHAHRVARPGTTTAPVGRRAATQRRTALVLGAGLAGASAARALAREGLQVTVLERRDQAALETSGNPAGLFHPVVHPQDGAHAQWLRAGAARTAHLLRPLVGEQADALVPGAVAGLLRGAHGQDPAAMAALLAQQQLPAAWAQALPETAAHDHSGGVLNGPAWLFQNAGWVSPAALVRAWLAEPGIQLRTGQTVDRIAPISTEVDGQTDNQMHGWAAWNANGQLIAEADVLVLTNAHDAPRLLAPWTDAADWPLDRQRGQISQLTAAQVQSLDGLPALPELPLASGSYLIKLPAAQGGGMVCGATHQFDDDDATVRPDDHAQNLAQVAALAGRPEAAAGWAMTADAMQGRVGWRQVCADKLPVLGPVAATKLDGLQRLEQPRHVPRVAGLYVMAALGSRGLSLAPLMGEVLAAWVCGQPMPVASSLLDAVDAARFTARARRRGG
ncbi:MAG: oxidoreductase [Burkholderiales bacterium PBB6]|nr:MAG: oxidoreductase [Burkholderiales bacterium PBB6]